MAAKLVPLALLLLAGALYASGQASGPANSIIKGCADYTVKQGDTLASIAKAEGTTVERIAEDNDLKATDAVKEGQVLSICVGDSSSQPVAGPPIGDSISENPENDSSSGRRLRQNDWRASLLNLVNNARRQAGAPTLCLNSRLNNAAVAHSQDQARRRTMTHTGGDGSSIGQRVKRAGYNWSAVAENVAWNQKTVRDVFNSRMNSPGHRRNILGKQYRHMGIGYSNGYWTQVFGASSSQRCS